MSAADSHFEREVSSDTSDIRHAPQYSAADADRWLLPLSADTDDASRDLEAMGLIILTEETPTSLGGRDDWTVQLPNIARADLSQALDFLFEHCGRLIESSGFDELRDFLSRIDLSLPSEVLVGAARITFMARDEISGWQASIYRIASRLERRGLESKKVLVGLL